MVWEYMVVKTTSSSLQVLQEVYQVYDNLSPFSRFVKQYLYWVLPTSTFTRMYKIVKLPLSFGKSVQRLYT